jgi:hypothetical protein
MSDITFDFNLFLKESKETLLNPKSYFSTMKTAGGITEPLIKSVVYGTVTGIIYLIWGFLKLGAVGGGMLGSAVGFMAFVGAIIGAVIGVFIGAVVILIIASICKGNTDFEANLRVSASVMVIMPISAFFGFAGGINLYLYMLWLLYNGLVEALKCDANTSKIACYVLIGLLLLFTLLGLRTVNRASRLMNDFNKETSDLMKDLK